MPKVTLFSIFLLFILPGCSQKTEQRKPEATPLETSLIPEPVSTAYVFPTPKIPVGFGMDSLQFFDSLARASYSSYYLRGKSPDLKAFNDAMRDAIRHRMNYERGYVEPRAEGFGPEVEFSYECRPVEIFTDGKVISIRHVIDTYGHGGNHHNYAWFCYTYDLANTRPMILAEVLRIVTREDSLYLSGMVRRNLTAPDCPYGNLPLDAMEFSIAEGGICFYPELSWACGMDYACLPTDSLSSFLIN